MVRVGTKSRGGLKSAHLRFHDADTRELQWERGQSWMTRFVVALTCSSVTRTHLQMMAALMRIPPTGSTHQPFFHSMAMRAITIAAELLRKYTSPSTERSGLRSRMMPWVCQL